MHVHPFKDEGSDRIRSQVFDRRSATEAPAVASGGGGGGSGVLLNHEYTQAALVASTTSTTIPSDNTAPQNTEGAALTALNTTITPTSATSILKVTVHFPIVSGSALIDLKMALFRDSAASSVSAKQQTIGGASHTQQLTMVFFVVAGSTSDTTFTLRWGVSGGTGYIGSYLALLTGIFDTARTASMHIEEYAP